jgi:hypothetical protein
MHVPDLGVATAKCDVDRTVVQLVAELLVEPEGDVQHPRPGNPRAIDFIEIARQRTGGDGDFAHTALEEISRQRRLGQAEQLRTRFQRVDLREEIAQFF